MKKIILLILLSVTIQLNAQTPSWSWAKASNGIYQNYPITSTQDNDGNNYTLGIFNVDVTIDNSTISGPYNRGYFLCKQDSLGNLIWIKSFYANFGGVLNDLNIALDPNNNIFIGGQASGFLGSNSGIPNNTLIVFDSGSYNLSITNYSLFFAKFDSNGDIQWAKSNNSTSSSVKSISFDINNNIYIAGEFKGLSLIFDTTALSNNGATPEFVDNFIAKYDSSGNFIWAKKFGGTSNEFLDNINIDTDGNFILTGVGGSNFSVTPSINFTNNSGEYEIFKVKINSDGDFLSIDNFGTILNYNIEGFIKTTKELSTLQYGYFSSPTKSFDDGTILNKIGEQDVYLVKYNSNGTVDWAKNFGFMNSYFTMDDITTDSLNNVYIAADFSGSYIQLNNSLYTNHGYLTSIIIKLDSYGNIIWIKNADGTGTNKLNFPSTINANLNGVFISGVFNNENISYDNFNLFNIPNTNTSYNSFFAYIDQNNLSNNEFQKNNLSIYPNPVKDHFNLSGIENLNGSSYTITDASGRIINNGTITGNSNFSFEVSNLKTGIYFFTTNSGFCQKFIKE